MQPVTTNPVIIMCINMTVVFAVLYGLSLMIRLIHLMDPTRKKEAPVPAAQKAAPAVAAAPAAVPAAPVAALSDLEQPGHPCRLPSVRTCRNFRQVASSSNSPSS